MMQRESYCTAQGRAIRIACIITRENQCRPCIEWGGWSGWPPSSNSIGCCAPSFLTTRCITQRTPRSSTSSLRCSRNNFHGSLGSHHWNMVSCRRLTSPMWYCSCENQVRWSVWTAPRSLRLRLWFSSRPTSAAPKPAVAASSDSSVLRGVLLTCVFSTRCRCRALSSPRSASAARGCTTIARFDGGTLSRRSLQTRPCLRVSSASGSRMPGA